VTRVRRIGALVLALAAVIVWFTMGPDQNTVSADVREVLFEADMNEVSASGAPQQQVVNGWAAKDLLAIIANQQADDRVPALVGLLVLGVALGIFTSPKPAHVAPSSSTEANQSPYDESEPTTAAPGFPPQSDAEPAPQAF
jgi:hypothetical protein